MSMRPTNWYDVEIDLGVVTDAFQLVFRRWKEYVLLTFITLAITMVFFVPSYFGIFAYMFTSSQPDVGAIIGLYAAMYAGLLVGMVVAYPFMFGIVSFTIREVRHGDATLADAWLPLRRFGRYAMAGLGLAILQGFAYIIGCIVGGFVVGGLFLYVMPIMVNEELGLGDAINESIARIKNQWLMATLVFFVTSIIAGLGQYACGIGILLTYPLMYIIPTMLYLRNLPMPQSSEASSGHSPYPRSGNAGYGAPSEQRGIGDDAPPKEETTTARQIAEEELRRDTVEPDDRQSPKSD